MSETGQQCKRRRGAVWAGHVRSGEMSIWGCEKGLVDELPAGNGPVAAPLRKGSLDTPAAATPPKGVSTGFVCPNAAQPAALGCWERLSAEGKPLGPGRQAAGSCRWSWWEGCRAQGCRAPRACSGTRCPAVPHVAAVTLLALLIGVYILILSGAAKWSCYLSVVLSTFIS